MRSRDGGCITKKTDATLQKELLRIHISLNALAQSSRKTTAKLAWTIEASIRQALAEARGNQWYSPAITRVLGT